MGDSPLHLAAWGGHEQVVEQLLRQPDILTDLKNKDGKKAIEIAKTPQVASLLLNHASQSNAAQLGDSDED